MKAIAIGFLAGGLFGAGLVVARMTDPRVVLAFLDVAGRAWDPSLLFVMAGAAGAFGAIYAFTARRGAPLVGPSLRRPPERPFDRRLFVGTAIFGLGWGLVGLCPGPSLVAAASGDRATLAFVAAMLAGIAAGERVTRRPGAKLDS